MAKVRKYELRIVEVEGIREIRGIRECCLVLK